jgi:hypothetical protein
VYYIVLIVYWLLFYGHILFDPFKISSSEILEYDFPIMRLAGECWKKGELPHDEYYYSDFIGVRPMLLYPVNILSSIWMASVPLDRAFKGLVFNVLVHNLITSFFAFFLFGGGLLGLFGALAWTYMAYHVQQSITRTQGFCWLTGTLCFLSLSRPVLAGVSLGLMVLCANPPYTLYFTYILSGYFIIKSIF